MCSCKCGAGFFLPKVGAGPIQLVAECGVLIGQRGDFGRLAEDGRLELVDFRFQGNDVLL